MHALPFSLCLSACLSHTHAHTHAIKQSASDQSRCPRPPAPASAMPLWAVNTIQRSSSLEDTKTSSYLTPDTNLRALGIKPRRTNNRRPSKLSSCSRRNPFRGNRNKVAVQSNHLKYVLTNAPVFICACLGCAGATKPNSGKPSGSR